MPDATPPKGLHLVVNSHTVCRDKDGKVKWEADTVPVYLPLVISMDTEQVRSLADGGRIH